jgi:hypothetical protein
MTRGMPNWSWCSQEMNIFLECDGNKAMLDLPRPYLDCNHLAGSRDQAQPAKMLHETTANLDQQDSETEISSPDLKVGSDWFQGSRYSSSNSGTLNCASPPDIADSAV